MEWDRLSRMLNIVAALQSGRYNSVVDLAEIHKVSRRTIFCDLDELKKIGISGSNDAKNRIYPIDSDFHLPSVNLNHKEAMSLLLIAYKGRNYIQLPFQKAILHAALKIENCLSDKIKRYRIDTLRNISIKNLPQAKIASFDKIFSQLLEAILKKQIVCFCYDLSDQDTTIITTLRPYHLIHNDYSWYVIGKSSFHKRVHAFKLNRIKNLITLNKCFIENNKFNLSKYLGVVWSMIPEGQFYNVKLKFFPEVAHDVAEVRWHSTQKVTFNNDGSAIVEFLIDGLNEITWWILSYGDRVQVLAPKILRQRIIEIAQKMVNANA